MKSIVGGGGGSPHQPSRATGPPSLYEGWGTGMGVGVGVQKVSLCVGLDGTLLGVSVSLFFWSNSAEEDKMN